MKDYCGNCAYLDLNQKEYWGDRYYCTENCKYKEKSDAACNRYVKKPDNGYTPAGCFITTVICYKLGFRDNCEYLTNLRNLRETYLKCIPSGIGLLQEYDQIGPIISTELLSCLVVDAELLMIKFIRPCNEAIKTKNYDQATKIYLNMVEELKDRFSVALEGIKVDYTESSEQQDLGKGRGRKRPANV